MPEYIMMITSHPHMAPSLPKGRNEVLMLPAYLTVDTYTHAVLYVHVCAYCPPPAALVAALRTHALYDRAGEWEEENEATEDRGGAG